MKYVYMKRRKDYTKLLSDIIVGIVLIGFGLMIGVNLAFDSILSYREAIIQPVDN